MFSEVFVVFFFLICKLYFPCYPEAERFYETFLKPKWYQVKKELPSIYVETPFEHSQTEKIISVRFL